jgi:hypothetical protein
MKNLNQGGKIDSILVEALEIERHIHNLERWWGKSADQSGNNWATRGTLTPFQVTSGIGDWGAWIKVVGTDDTPIRAGMTRFDFHKFLVIDVDSLTPYIIQFAKGESGDAGVAAGTFTEFMYVASTDNPSKAGGGPISMRTARGYAGIDKVWCRIKNATADTLDFFLGVHEYPV